MKSLTLRPHEARRLAEAGRVVVIRAVEPQPPFDGAKEIPLDSLDRYETDWGTYDEDREYKCPFGPPGTRLWGRETWSPDHRDFYPHFPIVYKSDGIPSDWEIEGGKVYSPEAKDWFPFQWRSPATMQKWASRFPDLVNAGSRLCRLHGVTVDEMGHAGLTEYVIALDGRAYDNFERAACKATKRINPAATCVSKAGEFHAMWDKDNPRHPAAGDPWVWVGVIEKQEGQ